MNILDIAKAIAPDAKLNFIGVRPGEKLHEQMISVEDSPHTYQYDDFYKILPSIYNWSSDPLRIGNGIKVNENFIYSSDNNDEWMSIEDLRKWIKSNYNRSI